MINIQIQHGDITKVKADAIINPANSFGWMGGGLAGTIKQKGGEEIEREVINKAPLEIGQAVATRAGKLPFKYVIHAPTMISPAEQAKVYNVQMSVFGALNLADDLKLEIIAMPGMGTGVGHFPIKEAAKAMIAEIIKFNPINLQTIILIDLNEMLVNAWEKELKQVKK